MTSDPKTPDPAEELDLGLDKQDVPAAHGDEAEAIEEEGEPFDGNFA